MKSRCLGQFNIEQKGSNSFGTVFWYMQLRSQSQIEGLAFRTFVYQIELRSDFVQKYIVPSVNQISPIHLELDFVPTKPKPIERLAFAISKEKCSQCFHRCHTTIPSPPSPRRASPPSRP
ncbi:hypothetical protein L1987_88475 [Smallanthus sonchifolius]|nr:hypothetical protein L1987_88475 [Smallanthus sonchifolius]